jgi:probable F420-dependent oxidoreductase
MTRPLRVGVQLPEVEREVRWPEYLAIARAAEDVGFDSIWLGDHLLYRDPDRGPWEAWSLLAALAAATERVRLGPLVACLAFHAPAVLAKKVATVDEISGGRLVLGVGAGWNEDEFRAFGLPFDRRVARFEESFEIVRRLLSGERVTFSGRFHAIEDSALLPQPRRRPPLMVGSEGERMLGITLPHVDAWNCWYDWYGNTAEGLAELNARIDAAAERAGRDPAEIDRSACVLVVVDRSSRERRIDVPPAEGTGAQIAARLRELADGGADEAILVVSPITEASVRALGDALAELGPSSRSAP